MWRMCDKKRGTEGQTIHQGLIITKKGQKQHFSTSAADHVVKGRDWQQIQCPSWSSLSLQRQKIIENEAFNYIQYSLNFKQTSFSSVSTCKSGWIYQNTFCCYCMGSYTLLQSDLSTFKVNSSFSSTLQLWKITYLHIV